MIRMQDFTTRRATADDFEAILSIHDDLYEGIDYIPTIYHDLLKDPKCYLHVAEKDGEIVSILGIK